MLRSFLLGSIRKSLFFIILLALLPAFGIIVYSSLDERWRAFERSREKAGEMVADVAAQCAQLETSAHNLLASLSRFEEVRAKDATEIKKLFLAILRRSPGYSNFIFLNADGSLAASGLPVEEVSPAEIRACDLARRESRFVVDGFRTEYGELILFFAVPLVDDKEAVSGVIGGGVMLNIHLEGLVAGNLEPGESIRFYRPSGSSLFVYPVEDLLPADLEAEWKHIADSGASQGNFTLSPTGGEERFVAFQNLPSLFGSSSLAAVTFSASGALVYAKATARFQDNLILLLLAACLALGIVQVLGRRIVAAPVRSLIRTARRLRLGDFSARAPVANPVSELGQLAMTFAGMAAALEKRDQEMVRAKVASDED
ncbi:MAG: HAMP domain-containing protein, partial [Deltaproteobacteria bacterium]|nr:HAMP domain-containing protein [Deltaproteobacteria bacterium]